MRRAAIASLDGLGDEMVLTVGDLSEIFQLSRNKATEMLATGKIAGGFRVGRLWRIRVKEVRE